MSNFLDRVLGRTPTKGSGSKAKERLQFVLVHDRINLPPDKLEEMKQEILAVISKYVAVDDKNVDIALQQRDRDNLLVAEIPFIRRSEGIERDDPDHAAEKALEANTNAKDENPSVSTAEEKPSDSPDLHG